MKKIKFKIAMRSQNRDIFPEIEGYLTEIHGIKVVFHDEAYDVYEQKIYKVPGWTASEYHSGRLILDNYNISEIITRKKAIEIVTGKLAELIEREGKNRVMQKVNSARRIND